MTNINLIGEKFNNAKAHKFTQSELTEIKDLIRVNFKFMGKKLVTVKRQVSLEEFKLNYGHGIALVSGLYAQTDYLNATYNCMLRALHDRHHLSLNRGLSVADEIYVGQNWNSQSKLMNAFYRSEVCYQAAYYHKYGQFIKNQKVVLENLFI